MERKESIVVQAAPNYENEKIREMERFGWELQGRQEVHESGLAFANRVSDDGDYVINTIVSKYVKLHFARSLSFPNLDKIKQIESEYFNLQFPAGPSLLWPYLFMLLWGPGIIIGLILMAIPVAAVRALGVVVIIVNASLVFAGSRWAKKRKEARGVAEQICKQSSQQARELLSQVDLIIASDA